MGTSADGAERDDGLPVALPTRAGEAAGRWFPARDGHAAVALVGGVGGGWDSPADGLYPRLARELPAHGIAVLRVRWREPGAPAECRLDLRAGIDFLRRHGYGAQGVVGHSFGGAVAVQAAAGAEEVRTAVLIATQAYGAEPAAELGARCSLLLVHGTADRVLPSQASAYVHSIATGPKRMVLVEGGSHTLDEHAALVHAEVRTWLAGALPRKPAGSAGRAP